MNTVAFIRPRAGIDTISPYKAGEAQIPGVASPIKLSSNETPFGPSPAVIKAVADAAWNMRRYPEGSAKALREKLATHHGLHADGIICGAGSEALIDLIARTYAGPGDEILFPEWSFPLYPIAARAAGATPVEAPAPNLTADVDALLAKITPRTKVVFLANPNNPTGTYIPRRQIQTLLERVPRDVMVVIDSAYGEYVTDGQYSDGFEFVHEGYENAVVLKTFSKIYGLASLRIGWAYGAKVVIEVLNRVRSPFNVSGVAQAAALAAMDDQAHIEKARTHTVHWCHVLSQALNRFGFRTTDSAGNFVFCVFDRADFWKEADEILKARGIIVRAVPGLNALRITVGTSEENQQLLFAIAEIGARYQRAA